MKKTQHFFSKHVTRLGRLGDPGVSPPPRQGSFIVFHLKTGLGTRPTPLWFGTSEP